MSGVQQRVNEVAVFYYTFNSFEPDVKDKTWSCLDAKKIKDIQIELWGVLCRHTNSRASESIFEIRKIRAFRQSSESPNYLSVLFLFLSLKLLSDNM